MIRDEKFGLKAHTITSLNSVFAQYPQIKSVVIYGSRAKGNYRDGSDIDLTIDAPTLDTAVLLKIENAIEELMLPYHIDLSLLHQLGSADLIDHIKRVGKKFFPISL